MKILLVEDDAMIQRMYTRTFTEAGYEVVSALDGQEGIDQAAATLPNIIMMDVMMPNVNGMQALEAIKANEATKGIPIIMLSANDDPVLMMKAMQLGANRFLVKSTMEPAQVLSIATEVAAAQ